MLAAPFSFIELLFHLKIGFAISANRGPLGQETYCPILKGGEANRTVNNKVARVAVFIKNSLWSLRSCFIANNQI